MRIEDLMYWVSEQAVKLSDYIYFENDGMVLVGCGATYRIKNGYELPDLIVGDVQVAVTLELLCA